MAWPNEFESTSPLPSVSIDSKISFKLSSFKSSLNFKKKSLNSSKSTVPFPSKSVIWIQSLAISYALSSVIALNFSPSDSFNEVISLPFFSFIFFFWFLLKERATFGYDFYESLDFLLETSSILFLSALAAAYSSFSACNLASSASSVSFFALAAASASSFSF